MQQTRLYVTRTEALYVPRLCRSLGCTQKDTLSSRAFLLLCSTIVVPASRAEKNKKRTPHTVEDAKSDSARFFETRVRRRAMSASLEGRNQFTVSLRVYKSDFTHVFLFSLSDMTNLRFIFIIYNYCRRIIIYILLYTITDVNKDTQSYLERFYEYGFNTNNAKKHPSCF